MIICEVFGHKYREITSGYDETIKPDGTREITRWYVIMCPRCGDYLDPFDGEEDRKDTI